MPSTADLQVKIEDLGKLKRKLTIEVPNSEVRSAYEDVYGQVAAGIKVNGFRPGKFPRQLAEKRFQTFMLQEASRTLVPKYLDQALKEQKLSMATDPQFQSLEVDKEKPLRFEVEFEVQPEFKLLAHNTFKLTDKPAVLEINAVDERIEQMRSQRGTFENKGDEPSAKGDRITFDYEGHQNDKPVPHMAAKHQTMEVGAGGLLPEFETALMGMKVGQEKTFDLKLPETYGVTELAGKTIQMQVQVTQVERKILPELNAEFFAQFGDATDLAAFKTFVEKQLLEDKEHQILEEYHTDLTTQIKDKYDFDVPEGLVNRHVQDLEASLIKGEPGLAKDAAALAKRRDEEINKIADEYRMRYVVEKLATDYDIKVKPEEVNREFSLQAFLMRRNPQDLIRSPYGESMIHQIKEGLLTQKVLTFLASQVLGKPMHSHDHDHEHGHDHTHHDHAHDHNHDHAE